MTALKILAAQEMTRHMKEIPESWIPELALLSTQEVLRERKAEGGGTIPREDVVTAPAILEAVDTLRGRAQSILTQPELGAECRKWVGVLAL
ncbi:hypothetical protein ACJU26_09350 [Acidithiobacillus sp. M4-SHS-6]|uniref:hypothetical protein n=1 Tax=Acidithiobacillus sp. M4-SHS-6 TaxID=3383024 RepID=UPI0039BEA97C